MCERFPGREHLSVSQPGGEREELPKRGEKQETAISIFGLIIKGMTG